MGSIVVDVMLKPEILDPQGQAVGGALPRLGIEGFTDVRQGKRFVLTVDGEVTQAHLDAAREAAAVLLSNPVIEDVVSVHAQSETPDAGDAAVGGSDAVVAGAAGDASTAGAEGDAR
ncbi:phosphoribosylformylglycinamidine synthase [Terracoccus luteus]|uniref:Phosphoribosylformylglycinamidine synthase subunit PurS n=1 Tax=Terracoccus luteus TaxID=53356 RepID=A0A495XY59_9MICO|nr:phosphoribosylformylglycinamidine synthase [Terracoccus luteus]